MSENSLSYEEKKAWFEDDFLANLDKWFTADVACCDLCHGEFLEIWPHADFADDAEFQKSSIDLDAFYFGSRLSEVYTKEEFDEFIQDVMCPRCDNPLQANIWPYSFPFDGAEGFEHNIEEIAEIANETPFLILKHPFASSVLEELHNIAGQTPAQTLDHSLYRAITFRSASDAREVDFGFPPNEKVKEGRYNHAGVPVLCLVNSTETCSHEIRLTEGVVAQVNISSSLKILDFVEPFSSHEKHSDLCDLLVYSALLSAKNDSDGWYKPEYVFSRFVSDCAKSAGFDAIKYPSTRRSSQSFNIVILNQNISLENGSINIVNIQKLVH